jgi:hypothetical protein
MPYSDPANKDWTIEKIKELKPKRVLDVGAGAGTYGSLIKDALPGVIVDAIEVWEPYIIDFNLRDRYDNVFLVDAREHEDFNYDLVIFGDILEHMTEAEAVRVWEKALSQAGTCIVSIPIIHYHQGEEFGNPYEVHVEEDWDAERVLARFRNIFEYKNFDVTGVFFAAGDYKVPKKIWQTYKTNFHELPRYASDAAHTWVFLNPIWDYGYMNDEEMLKFVEENFDSEWVEIFKACPLGVMRADIWRIMVVYIHGGIYADLDTVCNVQIDKWMPQLRDKKLIVNAEHEVHIQQWTFAAEPRHPALKHTLDLIKEGLENPDYNDPHFVHVLTGPKAFTVGILDYLGMWDIENKIELADGVFSGDPHAQSNKHSLNLIKDFDIINNSEIAQRDGIYLVPRHRFFHEEVSTHLYGSQNWTEGYSQWIKEREKFSNETIRKI